MIINHKKLNQTPKKNYEIVLHAMHCAPPPKKRRKKKKKKRKKKKFLWLIWPPHSDQKSQVSADVL